MKQKQLTNFNLLNYIIKVLPNFLISNQTIVKFSNNDFIISVNNKNLLSILYFFKNNYFLQFKTLISITAVDYPKEKNRFEINYFLLSYRLNTRIILKLKTDGITPVPSITSIYKGAGWYEREVWDLFGVFFSGHPDLRRILTDYGFEGFPLRKDFPQTGFLEIRYDDQKKYVMYESLEMAQEFRSFDFVSPWVKLQEESFQIKKK